MPEFLVQSPPDEKRDPTNSERSANIACGMNSPMEKIPGPTPMAVSIAPSGLRTPSEGLASFVERFHLPDPSEEEPVFVLASIWRSGSTLAQRMIAASGEISIWGEPYDLASPIQTLTEMITPISEQWPPSHYLREAGVVSDDHWMANLYPPPHALLRAIRSFLIEFLRAPAVDAGFARWGMKEIRIDGWQASVLKAVFPKARIIYLIRNPYDAWLSYRGLRDQRDSGRWWYYRWPDVLVDSPARFASIWKQSTESFLASASALGALVVTYEQLAAGQVTDRMRRYTGLDVSEDVLDRRVGSTVSKPEIPGLSMSEIREVRSVVAPIAEQIGYNGPTHG